MNKLRTNISPIKWNTDGSYLNNTSSTSFVNDPMRYRNNSVTTYTTTIGRASTSPDNLDKLTINNFRSISELPPSAPNLDDKPTFYTNGEIIRKLNRVLRVLSKPQYEYAMKYVSKFDNICLNEAYIDLQMGDTTLEDLLRRLDFPKYLITGYNTTDDTNL